MSTTIEIRLARLSDARIIAEMSRDLIEHGLPWTWKPKRLYAMIAHPECVVIVALIRQELAGFAVMEFHEEHAHLNLLAVMPEHRRHQIGSALLRWLEDSAAIAGIARINLEVRSTNKPALDFYKMHQYKQGHKIRGYYQGKESAYRMVHHLISPEVADQRP